MSSSRPSHRARLGRLWAGVALVVLVALTAQADEPTPRPPSSAPSSAPSSDRADRARFDSDAALAPHAADVVDYTLRASLDPVAHAVHGEGTITWRNASSAPVSELWVHLYLNAFSSEQSAWLRDSVSGARGGRPLTDPGRIDVRRFALRDEGGITTDLWAGAELHRPGDDDETDVRVPLPRSVAPGDAIRIDVAWDDALPAIVERTGYWQSFHMVAQWFPKIARLEPDGRWAHFPFRHLAEFYADYGTYDVTLDVPQAFTLGATGPAIDARVEAGRRIERHVQADVHDFAWTAWDEWQVDKETIDGVRVAILYPPGFRSDAQRELAAMRFALPWLGARYGRYPYEVLTLVHPPPRATEAGGMEYPTLVTTGGRWYGPPGIFELEAVAIHELGHQWFYGLVGTNEAAWPFLDEGLAAYAEHVTMEAWRGPGSMMNLFGLRIDAAATGALIGNFAAYDAPIAQPAEAFSGYDYSALVYARAAAVLGTVRRTYGDELTDRALGRYARAYRFQHPGPEELLATFKEVMGERVERAMRTALFDEGWVDYEVTEIAGGPTRVPAGVFDRDGARDVVASGSLGAGYEGSVLVRRLGTLSFPVEIELARADGTKQRVSWDGEARSIRVPYRGDVALRAACVDPARAVLLDRDRTNDFATVARQPRAGAPRTLERALYWVELAMQAVLQ